MLNFYDNHNKAAAILVYLIPFINYRSKFELLYYLFFLKKK